MTCYLYPLCCFKLKLSQTFTRTACLARQFLASFLFFCCRAGHDSLQTRILRGFPLWACLPTLGYDTFVIHWRGRGDRKMDDRDISARNYCYCRRAQILACIRTEEGCEGWEGGETISSVTNLVFTPGQEGKVIQCPPPMHIFTHKHTHAHAHCIVPSLTCKHTHTHTIGPCENYIPSRGCCVAPVWSSRLRVKDISAADSGVYTATHPDPCYLLIVSVLTWMIRPCDSVPSGSSVTCCTSHWSYHCRIYLEINYNPVTKKRLRCFVRHRLKQFSGNSVMICSWTHECNHLFHKVGSLSPKGCWHQTRTYHTAYLIKSRRFMRLKH